MSAPDLPIVLKSHLASEGVRAHHHYWHFVRNKEAWNELRDEDRQALVDANWEAPRFEDEQGSGIDFLKMHRDMIDMVNEILIGAKDPFWVKVEGWNPIPWEANDPLWPVPEWNNAHPDAAWARTEAAVSSMQEVVKQISDPNWLRGQSIDQLGTALEFSIHAWMHLRWSGTPPADIESTDNANDWLFIPWSSHVNKHFWKLHGWIDKQITHWEEANGIRADLSGGWSGPALPAHSGHHMIHLHTADISLMKALPPLSQKPLPMLPKNRVIEGILKPVISDL